MDFKQKLFNIINDFIIDENTEIGKDNANFVRSISVLETCLVSEVCKSYYFESIQRNNPEVKYWHQEGFMYHHQLSRLSPYCIGLSSYDVAEKGLVSKAKNERASAPPKRIDSLLDQAANLICLLAQEVSGATSINDLSTVLAGYLYILENDNKKINDYEIENAWQSFLYNVNLPFRSGNSPFSNVTLDFAQPTPVLSDRAVMFAGVVQDFSYKDIPAEYFDRVNNAFISAMIKGDKLGNPFTFPLITVNFTDDFDFKNKSFKYLLDNSDSFGGFYAQNYCTNPFNEEAREVNPYHEAYDLGTLYSNCCRMVFDLNDLQRVTGSNPFASGSGVGGIGVVAINLNRLMWITNGNFDDLTSILDHIIDKSAIVLEKKREFVRVNWNSLYPYLSSYVKDDTSLFSIISVVGVHEGLKSIGYEDGLYDKEGQKFAHQLGKWLREKIEDLIQKHKSVFNLEYAPSESAACKMAEKDLIFAKKIMNEIDSGETIKLTEDKKLNNLLNICIDKYKNDIFVETEEN